VPAFLITVFQFSTGYCCEVMNLICLTRQESLVDIIMNYVAFQGITQIDDLYLAAEQKMKAKDQI
jgi:hypothetical protein